LDNNTIYVPESDHVLPGVTQAALIRELNNAGYKVVQKKMTMEKLAALPNVMVTNALMGAVPVNHINGIAIKQDPKIGLFVKGLLSGF